MYWHYQHTLFTFNNRQCIDITNTHILPSITGSVLTLPTYTFSVALYWRFTIFPFVKNQLHAILCYVECNKLVAPSKINTSDHWLRFHIFIRTHEITTALNVHNTTSKTGHFYRHNSEVGHAVAQFVQAVRYHPECRGSLEFFHWHNPSGRTMVLGPTQPITEKINLLGWRRPVRRDDKHTLSCANCLEIWEPQPPGILWTCPGLYNDCFTYMSSLFLAEEYVKVCIADWSVCVALRCLVFLSAVTVNSDL